MLLKVPLLKDFLKALIELKSLKRFAAILSDHDPFNCISTYNLAQEQLGLLIKTGYRLGLLQVVVSFLPMPLKKSTGMRILNPGTSVVVSSLGSISEFNLLMAVLSILISELIAVKHFKIELFAAIYKSFGRQNNRTDTLKDVISQNNIPKCTAVCPCLCYKDYTDVFERAVAIRINEPIPLEPIPVF
uniref:Uncharacterized protein n=1 Tax=Tetranychus urticae TaxID=32264 RepID=T1KMC1_TETUR